MSEHDPDENPETGIDPEIDPGIDPEIDPGIDPGEEARIRSLLGEVGAVPEPIPGEVAARLDDTLAMLRAEREQETTPSERTAPAAAAGQADVVPLRRRWLPRAAGAAAAVIVLGVGGVAAVRLGTEGPSQDSAASGGAVSDTSPESQAPSAPVPSAGAGVTPGSKAQALRESADAVRALPAVTTTSFDADVTRLLRTDSAVVTPAERAAARSGADANGESGPESGTDSDTDSGTDPGTDSGTASEAPSSQPRGEALLARRCPGPAVSDGAVANPVRLDGTLAVLLVHPATDGEQLVEAWTCSGDRRLEDTRLSGSAVTP